MARRASDDGLPGPKRVREDPLEDPLADFPDHDYHAATSADWVLDPSDERFLDIYLEASDGIDLSGVFDDISKGASSATDTAASPRHPSVTRLDAERSFELPAEAANSHALQSAYADSVPVMSDHHAGLFLGLPGDDGHNLTSDQLEQLQGLSSSFHSDSSDTPSNAGVSLEVSTETPTSAPAQRAVAIESGYLPPTDAPVSPITDADINLGDGMVTYNGSSKSITFTRMGSQLFTVNKKKQGVGEYNSEEKDFVDQLRRLADGSSKSFPVRLALLHVDETGFNSILFLISGSTRLFKIAVLNGKYSYVDVSDGNRSLACYYQTLSRTGNVVTSTLEYAGKNVSPVNIYSYRCTIGGIYKTNSSTTIGSFLTLSGIVPTGITMCNFYNNHKYCLFMEYHTEPSRPALVSLYMVNAVKAQEYLVLGVANRTCTIKTAPLPNMVYSMAPSNAAFEISSCASNDVFIQYFNTIKDCWCLGCFNILVSRANGTTANYKVGVFSPTKMRYESVGNLLKYQEGNKELDMRTVELVYALVICRKRKYYTFRNMTDVSIFIR